MSAEMDHRLREQGVLVGNGRDTERPWRHANLAMLPLDRPLDHVPMATLVHLKIEVPDNRGGKTLTLVWRCDKGKPCEDARAEILDQLVDSFLDAVMPIPGKER